jgi:hypothetical protein
LPERSHCAASSRTGAEQSGPLARAVEDRQRFWRKNKPYLELRKSTAGTPPKPTTSAGKITTSEQEMAAEIRAARSDAKQGDIFTPEIAAYFRQQIASTLRGAEGKRIRASLRHAEPVKNLPLQVNQTYPPDIPLQSTPPKPAFEIAGVTERSRIQDCWARSGAARYRSEPGG